jgi:FkbM family methyltransferase
MDFVGKLLKTDYYINESAQQKLMKELYSEHIKEGSLCFDVGANLGSRIGVFLNLGAQVIAVEPQKGCVKYLNRKFKGKIITLCKAVGEKNDKQEIYISKYSSTLTSLSKEWIDEVRITRFKHVKWEKKEIIDVVSLDYLINEYGLPDFIKIDVEGYEFEVLKGLSKKIKAISFEYTLPEQKHKAINCLKLLQKIDSDYFCNYSLEEEMKYKNSEFIKIDEMIEFIEMDKIQVPSVGDIYVKLN